MYLVLYDRSHDSHVIIVHGLISTIASKVVRSAASTYTSLSPFPSLHKHTHTHTLPPPSPSTCTSPLPSRIDALSKAISELDLSEEQKRHMKVFLEQKSEIIKHGELKEHHFARLAELGYGNGGVVLKVEHKPSRIIMARKVGRASCWLFLGGALPATCELTIPSHTCFTVLAALLRPSIFIIIIIALIVL